MYKFCPILEPSFFGPDPLISWTPIIISLMSLTLAIWAALRSGNIEHNISKRDFKLTNLRRYYSDGMINFCEDLMELTEEFDDITSKNFRTQKILDSKITEFSNDKFEYIWKKIRTKILMTNHITSKAEFLIHELSLKEENPLDQCFLAIYSIKRGTNASLHNKVIKKQFQAAVLEFTAIIHESIYDIETDIREKKI